MKLRIATYNLENLDEHPSHGPSLDARIASLRPRIARLDADVLCLQEVNGQRAGKHGPRTLGGLDRVLAGTPYASFHRATTTGPRGEPFDIHNLVVLSRFPIRAQTQHFHDRVAPPIWTPSTAVQDGGTGSITWDRPALEVELTLPSGRALHVFDAHLRAPLASSIPGQKLAPFVWRSVAGWAEGYFVASAKRVGQALELRLHVDRLLDADPDALVLVAGDLNADLAESPLRILRADVDDTGNAALAGRSLVPLEERVPEGRRFSVLHGGVKHLLDHLLVSRALAAGHVRTELLNEGLEDEQAQPLAHVETAASFHAPVVAELSLA